MQPWELALNRHIKQHRDNRKAEHRRLREIAEAICKPKDRVRLVRMGDEDPDPVEPGTTGTVNHIDCAGTVHIEWDNGRKLGLIPGHDEFEVENGLQSDSD